MAAPNQAPPAVKTPNLYELSGGNLEVSYTTTGVDGQARLHYRDSKWNVTAVGDQISHLDGPGASSRVGMVLHSIPDSKTVSFVLVLPRVSLGPSRRARISTFSVTVVSKAADGGPGPTTGQMDRYQLTELKGNARLVSF